MTADLFEPRDKEIARLRARVAKLEARAKKDKADLDRYEEVVVGDLNETNIRLQREAARAKARVAELEEEVANAQQDNEFMKLLVAASSEPGHAVRMAAQAEAVIASVREAHRAECLIARGLSAHGCACPTCEALDAAPGPGTVTITQARHQHLVAGQCIHHQEIHRLHHGEPVAGCPYPGCHPDA